MSDIAKPIEERLDVLLDLDAKRRQFLQSDLTRFRQNIMLCEGALRRELVGFAEERRAKLEGLAAWYLQVLTTDPDYFGPMNFTREETSNSRFLAWLLGRAQETSLAQEPARAIWKLLRNCWLGAGEGQKRANGVFCIDRSIERGSTNAQAEFDLGGPGRIDIKWDFGDIKGDFGDAVVLIEAKIDATPSKADTARYQQWLGTEAQHTQLERYRTWLGRRFESSKCALILLDCKSQNNEPEQGEVDDGQVAEQTHRNGLSASNALAVTWIDVFNALVPVCQGTSDAHRALRSWLKTLAIIEGIAPSGPWEFWPVSRRISVLRHIDTTLREK